jgi:hypothetical protein
MNLIAATVTVYFMGLVNFHDPTTTSPSREVIVPLASATGARYGTQVLQPHQARVVLTGLSGGSSACTSLGGSYADPECTVDLSGKTITLPASANALSVDSHFADIPRLTSLCPGMRGIREAYLRDAGSYAARLTLTTGDLSACKNGDARIAKLTITTATPSFTIDGVATVQLDDNAVVRIANIAASTATDERAHFMWHYKMHDTPIFCTKLPEPPAAALPRCPDGIPDFHPIHTASGVGCTPTQYP